jgi:hypothetical protein
MTVFAFNACIVLSVATIIVASIALITNAWQNGGMKHDILRTKRAARKIIKRIISDIKLHPTN